MEEESRQPHSPNTLSGRGGAIEPGAGSEVSPGKKPYSSNTASASNEPSPVRSSLPICTELCEKDAGQAAETSVHMHCAQFKC